MKKVIGAIFIAGLMTGLLIWSTPVTRLGSGFLIGNAQYVFTYYDLVKDAKNILVKFPNENDIPAKPIHKNQTENLAILKLMEPPKVKRKPLVFQTKNSDLKGNVVFSLGYPWTNTLEDKHTLLEGALVSRDESMSGFLELNMDMNPIHSGSPLFNENRQVVGMILSAQTLQDRGNDSGKSNVAIPSRVLVDVMKGNKIFDDASTTTEPKDLSMEEFIETTRNNVVLIEAR